MRPTSLVVIALGIACITVHGVSNWWEKAWATRLYTQFSPDHCFRLEAYKPYWILPSIFQTQVWHGNSNAWGVIWGAPIFYRLYLADSGLLLGETPTFDGHVGGEILWELYPSDTGSTREITVDGNAFVKTKHCMDERSRKLMADYYSMDRADQRSIDEGARIPLR